MAFSDGTVLSILQWIAVTKASCHPGYMTALKHYCRPSSQKVAIFFQPQQSRAKASGKLQTIRPHAPIILCSLAKRLRVVCEVADALKSVEAFRFPRVKRGKGSGQAQNDMQPLLN